MSTDFFECADSADVAAAVAEIREAEDLDLRALYTAWHAELETPPAWYVAVGSPPPPGPDQGTDFRPGRGWVHPTRDLPKRTFVMPVLGGLTGAVVAVIRDRAGKSPVDRLARPKKARGELGLLYAEAVNASGTPFPNRPSGRPPGRSGGRDA